MHFSLMSLPLWWKEEPFLVSRLCFLKRLPRFQHHRTVWEVTASYNHVEIALHLMGGEGFWSHAGPYFRFDGSFTGGSYYLLARCEDSSGCKDK
uniref:Uncharacterized protein n=1 Tax=Arundo donax TaxID=35708 RepID=A0A0A9F4J1_ARUDO